ncbi:MAG: hypothetical protein Q7S39_08070 [Ignavibacteria bacterium]|nr:hypothetical protein [Ignavibacteria bacterium]
MRKRNTLSVFWIIILLCGISFSPLSQAEDFRIIYIIHGDGNYLFHNEEGNAINAAERILEQAQFVGANIRRGEVFIFYQKPAENFLLFFPKDDGEFHYYKNGKKISVESYPGKDAKDYEIEAGLIRKYSESTTKEMKNILLYYGHEIFQQNSPGYHSSYPEKEFGINIFANGVEKLINSFSTTEEQFDLIVLSTCRNGNRETINALSSLTDYLIASPGDIHLSHLNSESLINLNQQEQIDDYDLAKEFAKFAYQELKEITSTEISISLYDIKKVSGISDCEADTGITEFYRSPEFGRRD